MKNLFILVKILSVICIFLNTFPDKKENDFVHNYKNIFTKILITSLKSIHEDYLHYISKWKNTTVFIHAK